MEACVTSCSMIDLKEDTGTTITSQETPSEDRSETIQHDHESNHGGGGGTHIKISNTDRLSSCSQDHRQCQGTIVVVAKCPLVGQSKTRLIPRLGEERAVQLATAMLSDVLTTLSSPVECAPLRTVTKILLYAPATAQGKQLMIQLLQQLPSPTSTEWQLEPVQNRVGLTSHDLSDTLTNALAMARAKQQHRLCRSGPVVFLGMDCPELPLDEIVTALSPHPRVVDPVSSPTDPLPTSTTTTSRYSLGAQRSSLAQWTAHICPATDGGYVMLSVPPCLPTELVFREVQWSHALTAASQIKALTDAAAVARRIDSFGGTECRVQVGRLMSDIDEPADVDELVLRLRNTSTTMTRSPGDVGADHDEFFAATPSTTRLGHDETKSNSFFLSPNSGLWQPSQEAMANPLAASLPHSTGSCQFTRQALIRMGLLPP